MGGSSLSGAFGGPSTFGSNVNAPANTTPSVMGAMGKPVSFDPGTMAGTYNSTARTPTMANFSSAGMDATTGLPSYVTNFLQQGGAGTLAPPQYTMNPGAATRTEGLAAVNEGAAKYGSNAGLSANVYNAPPPSPAASTATDPNTGMTLIPLNAAGGYNQPGLQQPMYVSDMWNGSSSQQMATPQLGGGFNSPQVISNGIYTDSKGGYFAKDPSGKIVPLTGLALEVAKGVGQGFGYSGGIGR